jgi:hypothetical protein
MTQAANVSQASWITARRPSRRTYEKAKAVVVNGCPELIEALDAGEISVSAAGEGAAPAAAPSPRTPPGHAGVAQDATGGTEAGAPRPSECRSRPERSWLDNGPPGRETSEAILTRGRVG